MRLCGQPAADHQRRAGPGNRSAISFYQLARTVAYALGSVLSATVLALSIPPGHLYPDNAGYGAAAALCAAVRTVALLASGWFAWGGQLGRRSRDVQRANARRATARG